MVPAWQSFGAANSTTWNRGRQKPTTLIDALLDTAVRLLRSTLLWIILLPYVVTFIGAASNQLVLNANGDTFPVRLNAAKVVKFTEGEIVILNDGTVMLDDTHCVMSAKTHLNWLADIFDFHDDIESIGDMLLELGAWLQTFCPFVWLALVCDRLRRP